MKVEFLIVGQGIAGSVFSRCLEQEKRSFVVLDHQESFSSSHAAAGIMNPITGKRMVKTWLADQIFPLAFDFYAEWGKALGETFVHSKEIFRIFQTLADQNDLLAKVGDESMQGYLTLAEPGSKKIQGEIKAPHGGFEIQQGGYLQVKELLLAHAEYLKKTKNLRIEDFQPEILEKQNGKWMYKDIEADHVILAQGHQATENNLFNWLPFYVTKGELLKVKVENLKSDYILSKGCFLLPDGENEFWLGASYEKLINKEFTEKAELQLKDKIEKMVDAKFSVLDKRVGIRPTTRDRRPFLGVHPEKENLYIFNGLGTKGVTLAPYFAKELLNFISNKGSLTREASIERSYKYYSRELGI